VIPALWNGFRRNVSRLREGLNPFNEEEEQPKVAMAKNRWLALIRCMIHVPSVIITLILTILHTKRLFIGRDLSGAPGNDAGKLAGFQIAAKIHELLINASIAAMVHSYIVHQLLLVPGIPFGFLVADQRFTEISYPWDLDFWGGLLSKETVSRSFWRGKNSGNFRNWKQSLMLAGTIGCAVLLATFAAPSSAVAFIPNVEEWYIGGSIFYLNATADQLWPPQLNSTHVPDGGLDSDCYKNYYCPSAGYSELSLQSAVLQDRTRDQDLPLGITLYQKHRTRQMVTTKRFGTNTNTISSATTPTGTLAEALGSADVSWFARKLGLRQGLRYYYGDGTSPNTAALQPWTAVFCSAVTQASTNDIPAFEFYAYESEWNVSDSQISELVIQQAEVPSAISRLVWIQPPSDVAVGNTFPATMGAVVLLPTPNTTNASLNFDYISCNVKSRWIDGIVMNPYDEIYAVIPLADARSMDPVLTTSLPQANNYISINVSTAWADSLNPNVTVSLNSSIPFFASLANQAEITTTRQSTDGQVIETLLAMMFSDGLARVASTATLQGTLQGAGSPSDLSYPDNGPWVDIWWKSGEAWATDDPSKDTWHPFQIRTVVKGYAYSMNGLSIKLALIVLLAHACLAMAHILYLLCTGVSSGSWDRLIELVALAVNSEPTAMLENTCAGIDVFGTHGLRVRIMPKGEGHLQLKFGEDEKKEDVPENQQPEAGRNGSSAEQEAREGVQDGQIRFQINQTYGSLRTRRRRVSL
jgi:hypothetical protein